MSDRENDFVTWEEFKKVLNDVGIVTHEELQDLIRSVWDNFKKVSIEQEEAIIANEKRVQELDERMIEENSDLSEQVVENLKAFEKLAAMLNESLALQDEKWERRLEESRSMYERLAKLTGPELRKLTETCETLRRDIERITGRVT